MTVVGVRKWEDIGGWEGEIEAIRAFVVKPAPDLSEVGDLTREGGL